MGKKEIRYLKPSSVSFVYLMFIILFRSFYFVLCTWQFWEFLDLFWMDSWCFSTWSKRRLLDCWKWKETIIKVYFLVKKKKFYTKKWGKLYFSWGQSLTYFWWISSLASCSWCWLECPQTQSLLSNRDGTWVPWSAML